jgi:hypothetical protein
VPEDLLEQQVSGGGEAHGRPRVPRPGLLDRIHRQDADEIDCPLVGG